MVASCKGESVKNYLALSFFLVACGSPGGASISDSDSTFPNEKPTVNVADTKPCSCPTGTNGADGRDGADGLQGPPGFDGLQGPKGDPGPQGPVGPQGLDGLPGTNGRDGSPGATGAPGPSGLPGMQGPAGPQGLVGAAGKGLDKSSYYSVTGVAAEVTGPADMVSIAACNNAKDIIIGGSCVFSSKDGNNVLNYTPSQLGILNAESGTVSRYICQAYNHYFGNTKVQAVAVCVTL